MKRRNESRHRHIVRGGHGLPKILPGPTMPIAQPFYALWVTRLPCRRPAAILYPLGHPSPYAYDEGRKFVSVEFLSALTKQTYVCRKKGNCIWYSLNV
jgi:hypothetical protein